MSFLILLPDENQKALASIPFSQRIKTALARIITIYSEEMMFEYAVSVTAEQLAKETDHNDNLPNDISTSNGDGDSNGMFKVESSVSLIDKVGGIDTPDEESAVEKSRNMTEEDVVSTYGLGAMVSCFLGGIGEYSLDDIEDLFKLVDTDQSGFIDRDEFSYFIHLATGETADDEISKSSVNYLKRTSIDKGEGVIIGDESTIKYMQDMAVGSAEKPLDDWSMFYCGGSSAIEKSLRGIGKKYRIDVGVEKFDW